MGWRKIQPQPWRRWVGIAGFAWALCSWQLGVATAQENDRIRDHLYAIHMLDANNAWAVGSFGAIFRTKDGGKQWEKQDSGSFEPLYGVRFVNENEGWVSGKSGLVLHKTDGGAKWEKQISGTTHHLFNLHFVDNQRGIAVGDYGVIIVTNERMFSGATTID